MHRGTTRKAICEEAGADPKTITRLTQTLDYGIAFVAWLGMSLPENWRDVQADEVAVSKRKYERGHRARRGGVQWSENVCRIEEIDGKKKITDFCISPLPNRKATSVIPVIDKTASHSFYFLSLCFVFRILRSDVMRIRGGAQLYR